MKAKKSIFALLSGLLLTAAITNSPVFADSVKSGLDMNDGPYTIFNVDPERAS
ncbi:MAG: hypothetical protein MI754_15940 [Chromatiales bacterium]|nr:hypothetical protein [Chromatiales bacterium]